MRATSFAFLPKYIPSLKILSMFFFSITDFLKLLVFLDFKDKFTWTRTESKKCLFKTLFLNFNFLENGKITASSVGGGACLTSWGVLW
jgi:hypothetical protein